MLPERLRARTVDACVVVVLGHPAVRGRLLLRMVVVAQPG